MIEHSVTLVCFLCVNKVRTWLPVFTSSLVTPLHSGPRPAPEDREPALDVGDTQTPEEEVNEA